MTAEQKEKEMSRQFLQCKQNQKTHKFLSMEEIKRQFNQRLAPHIAGLWELAMKSMKFHLKKIIDNTVLTFPEFPTMIIEIQACLNSRTLSHIVRPERFNCFNTGSFSGRNFTNHHTWTGSGPQFIEWSWYMECEIIYFTGTFTAFSGSCIIFWKRWSCESWWNHQLQQRPKWQKLLTRSGRQWLGPY